MSPAHSASRFLAASSTLGFPSRPLQGKRTLTQFASLRDRNLSVRLRWARRKLARYLAARTAQPSLIVRDLLYPVVGLTRLVLALKVWLGVAMLRAGLCAVRAVRWTLQPRHALSWLLLLSLLGSSTPAAPQTIVGVGKELPVSLVFWFHSSGWAARLRRVVQGQSAPASKPQETQADRDARVTRVQIYPGDLTVQLSRRVRFVAVAYDNGGNAVGGVQTKWSAEDLTHGQAAWISQAGDFEPTVPGIFLLTAEAAGKSAQARITVPNLPAQPDAKPLSIKQVSNRDWTPPTASAGKQSGNERQSAALSKGSLETPKVPARASAASWLDRRLEAGYRPPDARAFRWNHASVRPRDDKVAARPVAPTPVMPIIIDGGWNDSNFRSSSDPCNRRGNPPGAPLDSGAGTGNFQTVAPVISLPGRGINIALALAGNSRVWNKSGTQINYDIDRDWPAPGFSLGFGKILSMGTNGAMLVDADGTRHSYTGSVTLYTDGSTSFILHTTDGTLIDYNGRTDSNGSVTFAQAKLANGTVISYGQPGPGAGYPTTITDPNGNYISITYVTSTGPQIQTVTDTVGRVITFYYDANNLLTAITGPGLTTGTRTLVRLHYRQLSLNYSFSGLTPVVRNSIPWVIDAIYYPSTNTGYWFGDADSYSSYGMLAKVVEERGLGFSAASLNDQGTVTQGQVTRKEVYNYPLYVGDTSGTQSSGLTDAPTYTSLTETWTRDGVNTDSATTTFSLGACATPRTITITQPNGTKSTQYSYNSPGLWNDGLVYQDVTWVSDINSPLQSSSAAWQQGAYDSPRPTRSTATDERGQVTATDFIYGTVYNQVTEVRNYDYGGVNLLRSTRTIYQNSTSYTGTAATATTAYSGRHIFNLPLTVEVYAGDNVTRVSHTDYQYDGQTLQNTPGVVMHDPASDPYTTQQVCGTGCCRYTIDPVEGKICVQCCLVSAYNPATDYRGNVTQVTSYADAIGLTGAVTETRRYDITGNMVTATTACCQQTSFNYTIDTQYAYPLSKTRGSATDPYAQVTTSATYDFNTGLGLSATDANGRQSSTSYDANTLRPTTATAPTGAHTDFAYDDLAMKVTQMTYLAPPLADTGALSDQNTKYLNGLGQVRREEALGANNVVDVVETVFDNLGRVSQQSRPYRSGVETPQFSVTTYDALSRAKSVTAPDGSMTQTFYNEATRPDVASTAPGETTRVQDAWGRERWGRTDAQGRLVEVVEPNPLGNGSVATGGLVTTYSFNTLGDLTQVNQGTQTRSFKYDSLRRLTAQKLAEMSATLNDAGTYVGAGTWSDVFTYDDRSNLTSRTDARGVKTVYSYLVGTSPDPLNRLQSVSWDTTGFGDTANPVLPAATVTYQYRTKATASQLVDVTQLSSVTAANISAESYGYDTEGRVSTKTLTLTSRPSYPMVTDYIFDTLDRVTDVRYPAEYGNGQQPRKVVHQNYDIASRLSQLTVDGQTHASNIVYNAASQTTSLSVGVSGANQITENYSYNTQTGLLDNQTVVRGGATTLLNLSYDYTNAGGKRTGQLTKITNNLDTSGNHNRSYSYDALGRLAQATGGPFAAPAWTQSYSYDRYGNRTGVTATGNSQGAPAPSCTSSQTLATDQFVTNFYSGALARSPNSAELNSWTSQLREAYYLGQSQEIATASYMGRQLFKSQEYASRNRSDHDFVGDLYWAYLQRAPDQGGWDFWTSQVGANGRDAVRDAFATSGEFAAKVASLCPRGSTAPTPVPTDGLASLTFDSATNRITTAGFQYDAAGNQTRIVRGDGSAQKFQYDAANRLVKVRDDYGYTIQTFTYGDSNQRLISQDGDDNSNYRTYYVGEGGAVTTEYTETPSSATVPQWSKSYIYLGNRLLSTLEPNGSGGEAVRYHHPDRLGTRLITTASETNPAGTTAQEQLTLPFGTALDNESTGASKRRFTSYDRSAMTGLDYAVYRHYDSQQGRFTQVDPIGMGSVSLASPQTLNLYAYCTNDPVNHVDPSGLGFFSFLAKIFGFIAKVLLVLIVVVAVVLTFVGALAIFGALLPYVGVNGGWALLGLGAAGFGMAFGPKWLQIAISVGLMAIGIYLRGPQAIWNFTEGGGNGGSLTSAAASVGAVAGFLLALDRKKRARRAPLSGRLLALFNLVRQGALKLLNDPNSPCAKFLVAHGFDPQTVAANLKSSVPYDALRSTAEDEFGVADVSPHDYVIAAGGNVDAMTNNPGTRTYYTRKGFNRTTQIHETLHRVNPALSDEDLARKLGATDQQIANNTRGTRINDDLLKQGGCR